MENQAHDPNEFDIETLWFMYSREFNIRVP